MLPTVVTGTAAQVEPTAAAKLGIVVLPLKVYVNNKEFQDGVDIQPGDLYRQMRIERLNVKTAAPSVGQYYQCFKTLLDQGVPEILCLTLSAKLSSDIVSATDAAEMVREDYPDRRVVVYDTLRAAVPQGLLAVGAARRLAAGKSLDEVVTWLKGARFQSGLIAALDSLDYLAQRGRIGKAAYLVGGALQIIPILKINDEGVVAPATIVRKKTSILPTMVSMLQKQTPGFHDLQVAVMHADDLERAEALKSLLLQTIPLTDIPILEFTPVMGAHTGPGLLGLGFLRDDGVE